MCDATPAASCDLPSSMQAPSLARSFVQTMLCQEHAQPAEAVVTLLADELVTQALLYGAPPVRLTLRCDVTEVTVEVSDAATEPTMPDAPDLELSMMLVEKIAHGWGRRQTECGKVVWGTVPSGAIPRMRSYRAWRESAPEETDRTLPAQRAAAVTGRWVRRKRAGGPETASGS